MFEEYGLNLSSRLLVQVGVFLVGLVISSFGLFQLFSNSVSASIESTGEVINSTNNDSVAQICTKDPDFGRLTVDIGGAIRNPGVYELEVGSRVNDLIKISGGFSGSVDKYYINKVLNLSQRLNDGEKFYIPTIEESLESQNQGSSKYISSNGGSESISNNNSGGSSINSSGGLVSINSASSEELIVLSGIGEKRSQDIIDQRPYDSLNQLIEKEVITEALFEKIKNDISL